MTREETLAWAKSLKPGDKVIYKLDYSFHPSLLVLEVEKVTPAGWVKTTNHRTFAQDSWHDEMSARGRNVRGFIVPATEDLLEEVRLQEEKLMKEQEIRLTIKKAKNTLYNELYTPSRMTYDRALKILEFFNQLDQTPIDTP